MEQYESTQLIQGLKYQTSKQYIRTVKRKHVFQVRHKEYQLTARRVCKMSLVSIQTLKL